jgi:hypothetical protein
MYTAYRWASENLYLLVGAICKLSSSAGVVDAIIPRSRTSVWFPSLAAHDEPTVRQARLFDATADHETPGTLNVTVGLAASLITSRGPIKPHSTQWGGFLKAQASAATKLSKQISKAGQQQNGPVCLRAVRANSYHTSERHFSKKADLNPIQVRYRTALRPGNTTDTTT